MDPRWVVEVPDLEAFLELVEDGDLETLLAEILQRASLTAEITWDGAGLTVKIDEARTCYELSGVELVDVVHSALELAAYLVAQRGFVLASAGDDNLELAVVPKLAWSALAEDARSGFRVVEPHARAARPRPSPVSS